MRPPASCRRPAIIFGGCVPEREPPAWIWLKERVARLRQPTAPVTVPGEPLAAVVKTAVVTDSAAALPPEWVSAFTADGRLAVVPMPVMVGNEIYGEGEDDITQTLSLALASGASVKTSRPSPGQFEQAYLLAQRRGFEAVVSIHISSELSGTADAARLAAARVSIPVEVVDSRTVGMAQGMGVQSAVVAAADGREAAEVRHFAERRMERTKVYFYVPSLEQLRRGGRGKQYTRGLSTCVFHIGNFPGFRPGVLAIGSFHATVEPGPVAGCRSEGRPAAFRGPRGYRPYGTSVVGASRGGEPRRGRS
ncbi:DegV family protein [Paenarthrobacter sp. RAF9]